MRLGTSAIGSVVHVGAATNDDSASLLEIGPFDTERTRPLTLRIAIRGLLCFFTCNYSDIFFGCYIFDASTKLQTSSYHLITSPS